MLINIEREVLTPPERDSGLLRLARQVARTTGNTNPGPNFERGSFIFPTDCELTSVCCHEVEKPLL